MCWAAAEACCESDAVEELVEPTALAAPYTVSRADRYRGGDHDLPPSLRVLDQKKGPDCSVG
ncbi:hypothetical protein Scani_27510 [Streptomyces caniferus]|uniref:Uncharacterized protein n=1 Tax=Streptomyces caniferus TaxID=285557 RepID=A0A640S4P2_9ACTN|nr:hypothetical protein Scani_27510 [Streptomyces caniferus]